MDTTHSSSDGDGQDNMQVKAIEMEAWTAGQPVRVREVGGGVPPENSSMAELWRRNQVMIS